MTHAKASKKYRFYYQLKKKLVFVCHSETDPALMILGIYNQYVINGKPLSDETMDKKQLKQKFSSLN